MAIYIKVRPHEMLSDKVNYLEDVGNGMVQPVTMAMDEGRWKPYRNHGIMIPLELVRGALLRIQKHDLDERGMKG